MAAYAYEAAGNKELTRKYFMLAGEEFALKEEYVETVIAYNKAGNQELVKKHSGLIGDNFSSKKDYMKAAIAYEAAGINELATLYHRLASDRCFKIGYSLSKNIKRVLGFFKR